MDCKQSDDYHQTTDIVEKILYVGLRSLQVCVGFVTADVDMTGLQNKRGGFLTSGVLPSSYKVGPLSQALWS